MQDEQYSQLWLTKFNQLRSNSPSPEVSIDCFPHGIASIYDSSIDLFEDSKPTYLRILFWLIVSGLLCFSGIAVTYIAVGKGAGSHSVLIFLIAGLLWPIICINFLGKRIYEPFENYISTKYFKLVSITASPKVLRFVLRKQEPIYISWAALEAITLSDTVKGNNQTVVFTGPKLRAPIKIALSTLHTHENWMVLSRAIADFAPHIIIDQAIAKALTLQSIESSFTELWLDSLKSAPDQASFELIPEGAKLNNDKYLVKAKLASGGQGHAYLCLDTSTNEEVVIKTYLLPVYQGKRVRDLAIEQLESEAIVLQRIKHPQIVHFIDWFCQSYRAFLVLNSIKGVSLRQWIKANGTPTAALATDLTEQMCEILNYLHTFDPPIVHRDFTPDNLIIDANFKLTLIDFTIAEPTGAVSGLPPAGQPCYMPPEQFRGESCVQSDIYALGGTLQFVLTGNDPEALEQTNLQQSHPSIPANLVKAVYCCRAQEVSERFQSVTPIRDLLMERN